MKILHQAQDPVLSNAEVLQHIQQVQARRMVQVGTRQTAKLKSPNFETIIKELTTYLAPTPSDPSTSGAGAAGGTGGGSGGSGGATQPSPLPDYAADYDSAAIRTCMEQLDPFRLTKAELVMVLNLRPTSGAHLDAIVEECDARLDMDQQEQVLRIVRDTLGGGRMNEGEEQRNGY